MASQPDPPPTSLIQLLHRIATTLRRQVQSQALAGQDITWPQYEVLHALRGGVARTAGDVAAITRIPKPSLAALSTQLQTYGLLTRDVDPTDHRVSRLRLTTLGERLTATLDQAVQEAEEALLGHLDSDTRESIRHLLQQLNPKDQP